MSESMRLKDQPVSERPRERLVARGPDALTPAELIAILLRTGLKGANAVEVGQDRTRRRRSSLRSRWPNAWRRNGAKIHPCSTIRRRS